MYNTVGALAFINIGLAELLIVALWLVPLTWALVEIATKEPSEGNDRIVWALIVIFVAVIGPLLYLIVRRPQRIAKFGR